MSTSDTSGGAGGGGAPGPGGSGGALGISATSSGGGVTTGGTTATGVAAKITHVKTTAIDAAGVTGSNIGLGGGSASISLGAAGMGGGGSTIMTSGGAGVSMPGGIKLATGGTMTTSLALNSAQSTTAIRAISAGGQSTQMRVVVPTAITSSMIKQLEGAAAGRTQITAIPASVARTVSNTSITVTRPVTQTTYLPRAAVTATQITGMGMSAGQRLVAPIRTSSAVGAGGTTVAGSFVRGTAVSRNSSSPATTVISPATSTTWMAANTSGHVQLIRTIPHQSRQRIITTQGIANAAGGGTGVSGAVVSTTATPVQAGIVQQTQGGPSTIQTVSSQTIPHSQQQQQQQQTYVATLATVLPPRPHQATLVYSSNVATSQPLSQPQQFNPTVAAGQRFAVATPLTAATATGAAPRQIRPIPLGKPFSTGKLNTTSISIRTPHIPQLTPTLGSGGLSGSTVAGATNPARSTTVTAVTGSTSNVIPTTNLSTTRIIQLQQQPGGTTQQIIGSTGRLAGNVMLQPIIVNTSGSGKIGLRPPVSMAAKVQPSLTITQLGIGKLPGSAVGTNSLAQQNVSASLQALNSAGGGVSAALSLPTPSTSVTATNLSGVGVGGGAQLVNVSQATAGQLLTTQNIVSSAGGATVVPLAITTRGGAGGNILTGTITPLKSANSITVGKVMTQAQVAEAAVAAVNAGSGGAGAGTSVYIHHAGQGGGMLPQRPHSGNGITTLAVATSTPSSSGSVSAAPGTTVLTSTGNTGSTAFLPPGSTIYYESVPASSVQVSTGVLSLTTTTVTSSTHTQNQLVSSGGSGLAISSLPFVSHAGNSTATFTVVPSSVGRTIGQLQIPVSSASTQLQALPVRFSAQLGGGIGGGPAISVATTDGCISVTQAAVVQPTQLVQNNVSGASHPILIPTPHQVTGTATLGSGQPQHMVIPLSTSIKVSSSGNAPTSSGASVVPSFLRKRDTDGSPKRAAKNLGPALLSIGANIVSAVASPAASSVSSSFSVTSTASSSSISTLTTEALAKKERAAATVSSARSSRADSPASSDGSTTVSANSSPGVDQQMQDGNLVINRIPGTSDSTHFNPINELYSNHHSISMQHNLMSGAAGSSRNSLLDHQHQHVSAVGSQRMNGGPIDCPPRKKSRRSTNDSQHSMQSQALFSLPPPSTAGMNNSIGSGASETALNNGHLMAGSTSHDSLSGGVNSLHHKTNNVPPTAGNKENAKPAEFVLRRPPNCSLLNGYKHTWKPANNHFQRYSDIKPREERRPTVNDLANQANVLGKINGWKIYHLRSQMEDLCENESNGYDQLSTMLKQMESHEKNADMERISELLKGNMQRSKIIVDGVNEAQSLIMKIFEHKGNISDIIQRCASKRNFKKREKV